MSSKVVKSYFLPPKAHSPKGGDFQKHSKPSTLAQCSTCPAATLAILSPLQPIPLPLSVDPVELPELQPLGRPGYVTNGWMDGQTTG